MGPKKVQKDSGNCFSTRVVSALRAGGVSLLFGLSSLIEAWILIAIVGLVNDEARLPAPLNSPFVLTGATLFRYLIARLGNKLLNRESSNFRSNLALLISDRYSTSTWIERQKLTPSELRAVSLYLPHELSNTRHAMLMALANSTSTMLLIAVAFVASPSAVLGLIALAPFVVLSSVPRARRVTRYATDANQHRLSHAQLNEILVYGFDELRPIDRQFNFQKEYRKAALDEARSTRALRDLDSLGPLQLTTIVFVGVIALLSLTNANPDGSDVAAYLVLLRVALLLQSVSQLPTSIAEFRTLQKRFELLATQLPPARSTAHCDETVSFDRHDPPRNSSEKPAFVRNEDNIFEASTVCFAYPKGPVIGPLNFHVPRNKLTCIVGPSGAGKSTLARLLVNDLQPTSGQLLSASTISRDAIRFVPQFPRLREDSIEHNVAFWSTEPIRADVLDAIQSVGLSHLLDRDISAGRGSHSSNPDQEQATARLSGGETLRIGLARATLGVQEGLLVLDEPTSALDNASTAEIIDLLIRLSKTLTVVAVTHDDQLISQAAHIIKIGQSE